MPLVLSDTLVLSQDDAALPAGVPLILWDNRVTFSGVSASSENVDYPATNLANFATNQEWRSEAYDFVPVPIEITANLSTADDMEALGIAGHNFGTEVITVEIGYYDTSSPPAWVSLAGPVVPATDEPLLFWFTPQPLDNIVVKLTGSAGVVAVAAVLYVGPMLSMERGVTMQDHATPHFARRTEFYSAKNSRGDYMGRIATSQFIDGVEHVYKYLTPTWYREYFAPFVREAQRDSPFFYAFDPDYYPLEVSYCWFTDDPIAMTDPITRRMHVTLKLAGIVE
jgi:hypothetical protein